MHPPLSDYASVKDYLYSLKHHGAKYGIDRMRLLSRELGYPETHFPIIHVAGTNGKGSTSAMLESIYRHAGYRTGLFTSPHLVHQGERIQVNRKILSHAAIVKHTRELRVIAERLAEHDPEDHPSFFEFMTAMAFLTFAREKVDVAIIETGLGGRLDATNVVNPALSIITSISYDHTDILGERLTEIAYEKAGIIKPGRPVVMGRLPQEAENVIRKVALKEGAPVASVRGIFGEEIHGYPEASLQGPHQRWNAGTATLAARELSNVLPVTQEQIDYGLNHVNWAGRWDRRTIEGGKTLILDAAHNEEGAQALDANLARLKEETGKELIIFCGALGEKRAQAVVGIAAKYAKEIIFLRPAQPRACSFETLEAAVPASYKGKTRRATVREIIPHPGACKPGRVGDIIVATGSIYLLGELLEALEHTLPVDEQVLQD